MRRAGEGLGVTAFEGLLHLCQQPGRGVKVERHHLAENFPVTFDLLQQPLDVQHGLGGATGASAEAPNTRAMASNKS